jgi:hypothetical protein
LSGISPHGGDVGGAQLFPCGEAEHLGVGIAEAGGGGQGEAALLVVEHRLVGGDRGTPADRAQPDFEPSPAQRAAPLMSHDAMGDAVEPDQCVVPYGDFVEAAPRRQECLGDGVIDEFIRQTAAAEVTDRPVTATVQLGEQCVRCGTPPVAHDKTMPGSLYRLRNISGSPRVCVDRALRPGCML